MGVVDVDGVVGAGVVVELDEPLPVVLELLPEPLMPEELPEDDGVVVLVPPELEPDLLKCASHSARDTWPSLFVSTDEKLGADELALALAPLLGVLLPDDMLPDAPLEVLCDALPDEDWEAPEDGVVAEPLPDAPAEPDDWLEPVAAGEDEEEDEDCATARVESANSTAAERVPTVFNIWMIPPEGIGETASTLEANTRPVTKNLAESLLSPG